MKPAPQMIIYNGLIRTMNDMNPVAEAVGIREGKITFAGSNSILNFRDKNTQLYDLDGKVLLPGFIDSHQHLIPTGLSQSGLNFSGQWALDDILFTIKKKTEKRPEGSWISGYFLHEMNIKEKRLPLLEELNETAPDHPIILFHVSGHVCVVNTRMFNILGFPLDLPGICRKKGKFTGKIENPGIINVEKKLGELISDEDRRSAIFNAASAALKSGITTLHCLEGGELGGKDDARFILQYQNDLPVRTIIYNQTLDIKEVQALKLSRIGGCILVDGAIENHTAALFDPYCDEPENHGMLNYSDKQMADFILNAHRSGLQIALHAIGDRAIEQILSAFESTLKLFPRKDHRHRIEHLELPCPDQLERLARAGIAVTVQPMFIPVCAGGSDLGFFKVLLGNDRIKRFHPYRQLLDLGILVAGGSDSPVTPYSPLESIMWATWHPVKDNRISIEEGFRLFTINAAKIGFEENKKGSIEPGKFADFVILSEDPWTVRKKDFSNIKVEAAIIGGKIVYQRQQSTVSQK